MRITPTKSPKIDAKLAERAEEIGQALGITSSNAIVERLLKEFIELIETPPEKRTLTDIMVQYDATKTPRSSRPPLLPDGRYPVGKASSAAALNERGDQKADRRRGKRSSG